MVTLTLLILFFLCWGSFLNVVGYRLIQGEHLLGFSYCIRCKHSIAWYNNIPIISYLVLQGNCHNCHQPISLLYPAIELFTACSMILLYYLVDLEHFIAYFIFFSALIITIRTDIETMLISRLVTITIIPISIFFSFADYIPIEPINSIIGATFGYFSLWVIGVIFYAFTHKQGIGEGDFELLALIGAFTGVLGVWASIFFGSILGSIIGLMYLKYRGILQRNAKLPFGPFLALGAIIYVYLQEYIMLFIVGHTC